MATPQIIKRAKRSGHGLPKGVSHTCVDGDPKTTAACPACGYLEQKRLGKGE